MITVAEGSLRRGASRAGLDLQTADRQQPNIAVGSEIAARPEGVARNFNDRTSYVPCAQNLMRTPAVGLIVWVA